MYTKAKDDKQLPQQYDSNWKYLPLIGNSFIFPNSYTPKHLKHQLPLFIRHSSQQDMKINQQKAGEIKPSQNNAIERLSKKSDKKYKPFQKVQIKYPASPKYERQVQKIHFSFKPNISTKNTNRQIQVEYQKMVKMDKRSSNGSNISKGSKGSKGSKNSKDRKNYMIQTSSTDKNNNIVDKYKDKIPSFFKSKFNKLENQITIDQFTIIKKLGEGKFGSVYLAKEINTNWIMAIKKIKKQLIINNNLLDQFIRQIKIQSYLDHQNILKVYSFFHDQRYFYLLMELGCDGQLYKFITADRQISEQGTSYIVKNLLKAVGHMHSKNIIHRDLKPQNIVLVLGDIKICDFGWAVTIQDQLRTTFCGTPLYFSPELLSGSKYDEKVDLWAIGILAYELHMCQAPFNIRDQRDLQKIINQQIIFPQDCIVSPQFKEFINCILEKNPKHRPTSQQLLNMHFIKKYSDLETCQQFCN